MEDIHYLIAEARKSKFSVICNLSDEDICSIWRNVSAYIDKQMSFQKGVYILGFGTFTFTQNKLDVGNNKYILIQRPVFILSEKFAQIHGLNYIKKHVPGQMPVVTLNYSALSFESPFDRDTIEACIRELFNALSRVLNARKNVEITFHGIGKLFIRDSKVKMKFLREFLNSMDGSGKLVDALRGRPGTCDSVLSERPQSHALSINTLVLPKINNKLEEEGTVPTLPIINEEETTNVHTDDERSSPCEFFDKNSNDLTQEPILMDSQQNGNTLERAGSNIISRSTIPIAKASGISFVDDFTKLTDNYDEMLKHPPATKSLSPINSDRPVISSSRSNLSKSNSNTSVLNNSQNSSSSTQPVLSSAENNASLDSTDKCINSIPSLSSQTLKTEKSVTDPSINRAENNVSQCGHPSAGQELCYLCHQRARRNTAVPFTKERERREKEEDGMLQQYQRLKETEALLNEQENQFTRRHENQKIAAFNLGVSEAIQRKKHERITDFHPSYVFQKRPITPPRFIKQEFYNRDLNDQVMVKAEECKKQKADEKFLERLEQIQLAEDLAAQRNKHLKERMEERDMYKRALSAQIQVREGLCASRNVKDNSSLSENKSNKSLGPLLTLPRPQIILPFSQTYPMKVQQGTGLNKRMVRYKSMPIPGKYPDSAEPYFGKNDMTNDAILEKRHRAHKLYREQLSVVESKKRDAILTRLEDQKIEGEMLKRTKHELLSDRAARYARLYSNRKNLEDDWAHAISEKQLRESREAERLRSAGRLLHEQCDIYSRCSQCKRCLPNCGESNIWRDSRYIPGSRLMV